MARLTVNGSSKSIDVAPDTSLLSALRDVLNLTGTKYGCGIAQCGACTVLVNGDAVQACQAYVGDLGDAEITTIEGLSGPIGDALKAAWLTHDATECGHCQPGQIMRAAALLAETPDPDDAAIRTAMNGNLCRCGTYGRIHAAIRTAATSLSDPAKG
ncbi:(2Fe-2S)-binding protein [Roseospira navarrensis]|uniref:2Fe-2S iron-sulfur cluster binding domain-containing protein n=1 Tax=Roseospira navarrensis TaxID=140058 RepID=A0A7X1ZEA1_9PROT|nr:(2Fe-2S)-binding protein [Roseospira navarrensis]MQX36896.1 2Fe-2S iron-sulfur cluster binding domain-containing protein [Roseospira navarrensis]